MDLSKNKYFKESVFSFPPAIKDFRCKFFQSVLKSNIDLIGNKIIDSLINQNQINQTKTQKSQTN